MTETTLEEKRKQEHAFYEDLYLNHGYRRRSKRWDKADEVCLKFGEHTDLNTWLDVGAGEHVIKIPKTIKEFIRTDPGHPDAEYRFAIHEIVEEFGACSFDVVSCFDVLEHLFPEELDEGIKCLWDVCKPGGRVIISVGTHTGGPWNGKDVHLTQEPMIWWKARLELLYGVRVNHVATSKGTSPFFVANKPEEIVGA